MDKSPPQTLSNLITTLKDERLIPKRRLSQNFIVDKNILYKIISAADIQKQDHILEIGPGFGALTKELLNYSASVLAIEKDPALFSFLTRNLGNKRLQLINDDFLKCDLLNLTASMNKIKVVANIPYHITSPIINKLTTIFHQIESVTLMVQKEMADRLMAKPGPKNNAFALFVQSFFETKYLFTVSKNCYHPKPEVHSAVIQLIPKPLKSLPPFELQTFVKNLFQKRRKMLRSSFSIELLQHANIDPTARPEELDLAKTIQLYLMNKNN